MLALAVVTVAVAAEIGFLVPERAQPAHPTPLAEQLAGVRQVMTSRAFWRYAPMFTLTVGGFTAVQGLWVARWLAEVEGLDRAAGSRQLTLLNAGFLFGCLFMGFMTTPLIRRGITEASILAVAAGVFVLVFAAINAAAGPALGGLWVLLAFLYPLCNIAFAIVGRSLPLALAGRANTALNLATFVGAFTLQWGVGLAVDALRAAGWDGGAAYRATFGGLLALQAASVAWMFVARGDRGARPPRERQRARPVSSRPSRMGGRGAAAADSPRQLRMHRPRDRLQLRRRQLGAERVAKAVLGPVEGLGRAFARQAELGRSGLRLWHAEPTSAPCSKALYPWKRHWIPCRPKF
jgi:hypothetical protein